MITKYKVIKPYRTEMHGIVLPVGTVIEWWSANGYYLSTPVTSDSVMAPVRLQEVQKKSDHFEKVEE